MKIVIDISNEMYSKITDSKLPFNGEPPMSLVWAVKNGAPLPKGHGRLVEVDKLCGHCGIREFNCYGDCDKCEYYVVSVNDIHEAKAIIEADKEAENETDN